MSPDVHDVLIADVRPARPSLPDAAALVRACEDAGFDAVVLHDDPAAFEATTLAGALAPLTRRIGLLVAGPAGGLEPYHHARFTASLDHLTRGRSGWFVTAGPDRSGAPIAAAAAAEYVEVVRGLWDSFEDGAFVHDRARGVYWELDQLRTLGHEGPHYRVAGPLNVARPPQGHPLVVAARADLAAHADLVTGPFTGADPVARVAGEAGTVRLSGAAEGLLVAVHAVDDPTLAAAHGRGRPVRRAAATLRERLGIARPANTLAQDRTGRP